MQVYSDDEAPRHFLRNSLRRFRRLLKGSPRQQAVILFALVLLLVVALRSSQYLPSTPTHLLACSSPRAHLLKSIPVPREASIPLLSEIWKSLRDIFDGHPPQPLTLKKVTFKTEEHFPEIDIIKNHTNLSLADAQATRLSHVEVTKKLPSYPEGIFSGRGIIMLAGARYSDYAATGLGMLREINSRLPIEVWMKDEKEEKAGWCDELRNEGMACRRVSDYMDVSKLEHGYQLKATSILFSSFEQILFLDGDNIPIRKPDGVFDSKSFMDSGVVLWTDYWRHTGSPFLPYIIGLTQEASDVLIQEQNKTIESGQLMWDKKRHWKSLCLATYYNYYGPQHYYTLISQGWAGWGDKDTFPMALRALRQDYYIVPHALRTLFVNGTTHGIGMLQADPTNQTGYEPMFLHSNVIKWGIHSFMCTGCTSKSADSMALSVLEYPESSIYKHLKEHHRIFNQADLEPLGIDPEPLIWRSMEHAACRSVWKDHGLCNRAREHMEQTFGHQFKAGRFAGLFGYQDICILNS